MAGCAGCGADNPAGARYCNSCGASLGSAAATGAEADGETRKTVTVVFCDVTDSTALGERIDPESLRRVLARYFAVMRTVIERYGGTVEKFIGDAVMAVFGVPIVHEDDALRAVRAAWSMTEALASLNEELAQEFGISLQARIGVDTGEVVTGTSERLATGDTVNVAARLEQSAAPGQIVIGEETFALTRGAVDVERRELELKGKSRPVPAYVVLSVHPGSEPGRRLDAPIVGRKVELRKLHDAFDDVVRNRACRLFTIVGPPGVGKTRLTRELLESNHASTLSGRCLSYGDGVTYWPIVEALAAVAPRLSELAFDTGAATIIDLLLSGSAMASTDEIAWAFRKLVEAVAAESPVKLLFDDIQWGEDAFLDLVEHLALLSQDAPILVVCLARPELLAKRPGWAVDVRLEPLPPADAERLVDQCIGSAGLSDDVRTRILAAAEGNPLFVEEMTAMIESSGEMEVMVPPSIHALLAARIDQLDPLERRVLARAAIEGEVFHRSAIQALLPEERSVTTRLSALVRKDVVKPHPAQLEGEDGFRFRHLLIRDAAYDGIPKAVRADLHEKFARWLEDKMRERLPEAEAILGYHLEQAARYRLALGPSDEHSSEVARKAGALLASAGNRTLARGDAAAAVTLLSRAVSIIPPGETARLSALLRLGWASRLSGDLQGAMAMVDEVIGAAAGQRALELQAKIIRARLRDLTDPLGSSADILNAAQAAIPVFEELGDNAGLAQAWQAIAHTETDAMHCAAMIDALKRSTYHAQLAGDEGVIMENDLWIPTALVNGPTPTSEMTRIAAEMRGADSPTPRHEHAWVLLAAMAAAFGGRFDEARELVARGKVIGEALGQMDTQVYPLEVSRRIETLAGDAGAAEKDSRRSYEIMQEAGAVAFSCSSAALLALALYELGRYAEATEYVEISRSTGSTDDVINEVLWRRANALLCARRGESDAAVRLASEAVALMETTDSLDDQGDALVDLAEVLRLIGRVDDDIPPLRRALALYEQKENLVSASTVRERIAGHGAASGLSGLNDDKAGEIS